MKLLSIILISFSMMSCAQSDMSNSEHDSNSSEMNQSLDSLQTAYFASGCFWCVEAVFESVKGVQEAVSGYSGGASKNPTYKEICTGRSGHAEAVKVYYDSSVVSYETLVEVFFNSHDPSTLNRQGPDSGTQYRSEIFYETDAEREISNKAIQALRASGTKVTTAVSPLDVFWDAEDYHQDYERLNPNQSYIRAVSIPRLNAFKAKMPEVLKN
ncbi:MAG: peptide-methionine (S)-S-oxide reductase MsrA [Crocinitomicaceae bacterium]|nr:peptide-methionine (S)-S-oxide reductase MsrA [Flavobacteriales bacterium]NQZ37647.1 peptide-methionine (S)-S-oxide reductase MsrA [Crocinitomicaceae bacterium]